MLPHKTVDEYILNSKNGIEILLVLRDIIKTTELQETIKWGVPCYTINGKNVLGLGAFKSYVGIWFFQGALLNDKAKVLKNTQDDKTKALRQWHFKSVEELDDLLILEYINEAIENQKQNKVIKPNRSKTLIIPPCLEQEFRKDAALKAAFYAFTPGKQREFAEHIMEAKLEKTKRARLNKITPLIKQNIGLNDKYRK
ncbi:DUF1801 domain-containing protein [uncultured Draconibacterium sp.]|uniref:YdeI/OmpD-associated family protein n=1 Tax=uncultured Draconibacterium sp. TaxID=1573823 RepID=UPI003216866F